jgi:hypothetical protein
LSALERGGNVGSGEISRKRERMEQIRRNGDGTVEGNGLERRDKKVKLDVFDFDEYDGVGAERMRRDKKRLSFCSVYKHLKKTLI